MVMPFCGLRFVSLVVIVKLLEPQTLEPYPTASLNESVGTFTWLIDVTNDGAKTVVYIRAGYVKVDNLVNQQASLTLTAKSYFSVTFAKSFKLPVSSTT